MSRDGQSESKVVIDELLTSGRAKWGALVSGGAEARAAAATRRPSRRMIRHVPRDAADFLAEVVVVGQLVIEDFGAFTVKEYPAYAGRNPTTGEVIAVEAKTGVLFDVARSLRARLDGVPANGDDDDQP